jgi:inorganic pyrophosphatase
MSQPANGTVIGVKRVGALCLEDGAGRDPVYCGHIRAREIVGERIALG